MQGDLKYELYSSTIQQFRQLGIDIAYPTQKILWESAMEHDTKSKSPEV